MLTSFFFDQSSTLRVGKGTGIGSTGSGSSARLDLLAGGDTGRGLPVRAPVALCQVDEGRQFPLTGLRLRGTLSTPAVPIIAAAVADFRNRRRFRLIFVSIFFLLFSSGHVDITGKGLLKFVHLFPFYSVSGFVGCLRQALLEINADDLRTRLFDGRGHRGNLGQDIGIE